MSESGEPVEEKAEVVIDNEMQKNEETEQNIEENIQPELHHEENIQSEEVQKTKIDIAEEEELTMQDQEKEEDRKSSELDLIPEKEPDQDPLQELESEGSSSQSKNEDQEKEQDQEQEQQQVHDDNHEPDSEYNREQEQQREEHIEGDQDPVLDPDDECSHDTVPMTNTSDKGIDDEEMPSMVNLSSPFRQDESELCNRETEESKHVDVAGNSPLPQNTVQQNVENKDSDSDSVCVIDDDDDEEEDDDENEGEMDNRDHRFRRMEDEEDYSSEEYDGSTSYEDDSEETEREHYRDRRERKAGENIRREIEEDDEENEEEPEDQGEYLDEEPYDDCGGGSDDIVMRHSNGFFKENTERSSSLQDLSVLERQPKIRPNINPFSQKAIFERNQTERKPVGRKYDHVNSKVKEYILEEKRKSTERRRQIQEEARQSQEPYEPEPCRNVELMSKCREMKDYAEKELREVAECEEDENMCALSQGIENGDISIFSRRSTGNEKQSEGMEVDPINIESQKDDKINGAVTNDNHVTQRKGIYRREENKQVLNGEDPLNTIHGVRTLSYEEYMKGSVPIMKEVAVNNAELVEEMQYIPTKKQNNDALAIKIESVMSNYDNIHDRKTPPLDQSVEGYYPENLELNTLKMQLNERNLQFENLKQAYQKTVSTNMSMQRELENLKKAVAYLKEQQKSTKELAIQTERDMPIIDLENDPKGTTMSSQWSESTCSAAISMDPPNVTATLASDESTKLPPHKKNALSRAFMTSTRILQTLSSITYGRTKVDKGLKPPKVTIVEKESIKQNLEVEPPNLKKRKASDAMETSAPPSKLSKPDSEDFLVPEAPITNSDANKDDANVETSIQKGKGEVQTLDDDVKVFLYSDDSEEKGEHSFLIQAKEVGESVKPGVRECGPYLLGNIEVYMTEMNGTINIWGKELSQGSQESTSQVIEELDISTKSKDLRQGCRWQSTPRIFNNGGTASTSKQSRVLPRYPDHEHHSCPVNTIIDCDHCNPHSHRLSWPSCNQNAHENQHTCCPPSIRVEDSSGGCAYKQERTPCCQSHIRTFSLPNVHSPCCCNHNHCRNRDGSHLRHQQQIVRRHSFNPTDDENDSGDEDANHTLLSSNTRENSPQTVRKNKLTPNSAQRKSTGGNSSEPSTCDNETDPLISQRQTSDAPEGRKRRSSKGKVRGLLMDLLKGCGDCKATTVDKNNPHHNASIYEPSTSKVVTCPPNMPSCTSREKCSTCSNLNKKDVASEIAAQLETFQTEMEKLRSRSDTLHQMLDRLRNDNNPNV